MRNLGPWTAWRPAVLALVLAGAACAEVPAPPEPPAAGVLDDYELGKRHLAAGARRPGGRPFPEGPRAGA